MGQFIVEFARGNAPGPLYDDYAVDVATTCGADGLERKVRFNDIINGDFVVGRNYFSDGGFAAQNLRIESYTDTMIWQEIATGNITPAAGFIPSELKNNTTNINLTYPYTIPIANVNTIGNTINSAELICNGSPGFVAKRTRVITYLIFDSNGQAGPLKQATFTNSQAS